MAEIQQNLHSGTDAAPFRIDAKLHQILYKKEAHSKLIPNPENVLPEPVYPMKPNPVEMTQREYQKMNAIRTWKTWGSPYFKSRWHNKEVRPIIPYLFTEWKCNLDCHYCWSYDNRIKGMTEDTARRAIDWLESTPCRVLAPTGGEPLIRPDFVHKVVYYAAKKDFWVYLATNARLLRPEVTDRLADAGIATVNFAVDTIKEKPGLPKALEHVRANFDHL